MPRVITLSPDKLKLIVKKAPVTLIRNISEIEEKIIKKRLQELGAIASFKISENGSGTDFDFRVVQAFLKAFSRGDLEVFNNAN